MLFAFRWCLEHGCPHPKYIPLSAEEFLDWVDYWRYEPFGDQWRQTAMVAYVQALQLKSKRKLSIDDFMPVKQPQSPEQVKATIDAFFKGLTQYGKRHDRKHDGGNPGDR